MNIPSITVLMTVYNGGEYLPLAVNSVLSQTYKDFEFLIIEDKGTDGSLKFLQSLYDPRVRLHANPQNIGQTKSLNLGLGMARGGYIARMDADDVASSSHWLENLLKVMAADAHHAVVSPRAAAIDSSGKFSRVLNSPRTAEDILLKSFFASPINHVGSLMRRTTIQGLKGYDESFKVAADYDLWSRLLRDGHHLVNYPEVLVSVRYHDCSATRLEIGNKVIPEMTRIMRANISHWKKLDLDDNTCTLLWRLMYTPEVLSQQQYREGMDLLEHIYGPCRFLKRQKRIVLAKRILGKLWPIKKKPLQRSNSI